MEEKNYLLQFPCVFPLKVIGHNSDELRAAVRSILGKHLPGMENLAFSCNSSCGNKYLSITVTIIAESKEQLDMLYQDLNSHELVLMTL